MFVVLLYQKLAEINAGVTINGGSHIPTFSGITAGLQRDINFVLLDNHLKILFFLKIFVQKCKIWVKNPPVWANLDTKLIF